jgi:hypothetical protein
MQKVYIASDCNGLDGFQILGVFSNRSLAEEAIAGLELGTVVAWEITNSSYGDNDPGDTGRAFVSHAEERRYNMSKKKFPKVHRTSS